MRIPGYLTTALILVGALCVAGCKRGGQGQNGPNGAASETITIGSKNFTEQMIIGEMMAQLIEAKTDLNVKRVFNLGGTMVCHNALKKGEIDVYAEYTGTALTAILKEDVIADPQAAYDKVAPAYNEQFQCEWLQPFGFNNTYAITVRRQQAEAKGWQNVSDLAAAAEDLSAAFTAEFMEREDGYPGIRKTYGFEFGKTSDMDPSLMYKAVANGDVDVICAFATDGRIAAYDLQMLTDDKGFFPPYYAAPVVRQEVLQRHPELKEALNTLAGKLDDRTMQRLNNAVDAEKKTPEAVAKEFLTTENLIGEQ